ncbi:hypothetical protein M422DRAFT_248626 [Sphaerobolus stellatus SS14]|uniref:Uncharacterized protein n=1 Tax=Sphaerobolus stellatus (strain SS14) TaxID=990650 RepID=A0A0C9VTZ9_SPHS4|nr:hypothetical protein M422DRAFT_255269 [Sphaerobolus stellatus SS14]KIJ47626.1 hypothetical protein M422DRAFT_248626 [Sphaerobolus stellatus SS14]
MQPFHRLSSVLPSPLRTRLPRSPPITPSVPTDSHPGQVDTHEDDLRMHYFAPYLKEIDDAYEEGTVLNWHRGECKSEPWGWPLNEEGQPFHPQQLDHTFQLYDIPMPTCPCESQGTGDSPPCKARIWIVSNPASSYRGEVAIACQRRNCGFWKSLSATFNSPDLITVNYQKRTSSGPGLIAFDPQHILDRQNLITPPTQFTKKARRTGYSGAVSKRKNTSDTSKLKNAIEKTYFTTPSENPTPVTIYSATTSPQFPPLNQLALCPDVSLTQQSASSGYAYDVFGPVSTHLPSPSTVSIDKYTLEEKHQSLQAEYQKVKNDLTILKIQYELEQSKSNRLARDISKCASDRFWGETGCLYFLPDCQDICRLNRDVPPLDGEALTQTLTSLFSPNGISKEALWCAIDICNCDRVFAKGYLHSVHARTCLDWPMTTRNASPSTSVLSPSTSESSFSVVEEMLTPDNSPISEPKGKSNTALGGPEFDIHSVWDRAIGSASAS